MSIVNNYKFSNGEINFVGDYTTHRGTPSILRSDSMLKAIGKSINIRVSGKSLENIIIIIIGNSPITEHYVKKVDFLKRSGIIQNFISLYPNPTTNSIENTPNKGFQTFFDYIKLSNFISNIIESKSYYFSSMMSKQNLGEIISIASKEANNVLKAEKFLKLIRKI